MKTLKVPNEVPKQDRITLGGTRDKVNEKQLVEKFKKLLKKK